MRLLVMILCAGCSSPPTPQAPQAPLPGEPATSSEPYVSASCVPAGFYKVTVDLDAATISQVNTGMGDTEWCKSMLIGVPSTQLNAMRIGYENGMLEVRWPPSRKVTATSTGDCGFYVADQPVAATFKFAGGKATGTSTYSIGTANHPDERCTAENATFVLERTGE